MVDTQQTAHYHKRQQTYKHREHLHIKDNHQNIKVLLPMPSFSRLTQIK